MTKEPFRTTPVLLLSLPGVLLVIGALVTLARLSKDTIKLDDIEVSSFLLLTIAVGLALGVTTLITSTIVLVYTLRRTGDGLARTGFAIVNGFMLLVALGSLAGLFLAIMVVGFNPG